MGEKSRIIAQSIPTARTIDLLAQRNFLKQNRLQKS